MFLSVYFCAQQSAITNEIVKEQGWGFPVQNLFFPSKMR